MDRQLAEEDERKLQLIPYMILKTPTRLFAYERLKGGNEDRLHNMQSIGIGGHVEKTEGVKSFWEQVECAAFAELGEEVILPDNVDVKEITFTGDIIYDDSNAVGRVHLGVLSIIELPECTLEVGEPDKIAGLFYDLNNLKDNVDLDKFETWSQIAFKKAGLL